MVPEDVAPFVTSWNSFNFLEPLEKVEAKPNGRHIDITLEARRHWSGIWPAHLNFALPLESALRLYGELGKAIDALVQNGHARAAEVNHT